MTRDEMPTVPLKTCPFCGHAPEFVEVEPSAWAVSCENCGAGSEVRYSLMEDARPLVAESWNTRDLDFRTIAGERAAVVPCYGERPAFIRDDDLIKARWDDPWVPAKWKDPFWTKEPAVILRAREQNGEEG